MGFDLASALSRLSPFGKTTTDEDIHSTEADQDAAYAKALARRDAIAAETARLQRRLQVLKIETKRNARWLKRWSRLSGKAVAPMAPVEPKPVARPLNAGGELVAEHMRRLIEENKAPMSREALMDGLSKDGIIIEGPNPEAIVSTIIAHRTTGLVLLKRLGYWLSDKDFEPAGYKAGQPMPSDR